MGMGMVDFSGEEDGSGFDDMGMMPLDSPDQDSNNINSDGGDDCGDGGGEILPIPPPHSPSPTLHTTRPDRFKRQQISSPVMHLRMKWKKSLIRSVRAAAAEAAAEEANEAKAKAEAEAKRTVSIPDYMNMAMAMAMDDSKSVLAGCEIMGLGITVDGNGGWCLRDVPPVLPAGGKMLSGSGGRHVNGSYRGLNLVPGLMGFLDISVVGRL